MADFKSVSWNAGEAVSRDKLTTMANNDDILNDRMPKVRVTYPTQVNTKTKILAGRTQVNARKGRTFANTVNFGSFFTTGTYPIVSATVVSDREDQIWLRVTGPNQIRPTHAGCIISGIADPQSGKKKNIEKAFFVDWIAVGY